MNPGRWLGATAVVAGLTLSSACGVPTGGGPTTIAASDVPYGLASPSTASPASPSADPKTDPSRIFLVAGDDALAPRPRDTDGSSRRERLEDVLSALATGPSGAERDEQLSTALPPEVRLTVVELSAGTATIDIAAPAEAPSGWASRRAVAQIVLTATSVPGVEAVRLTLDGSPVEAPLPSGELTSAPLTAADYAALLIPASAPPS
jgi:spore germination protein GerM